MSVTLVCVKAIQVRRRRAQSRLRGREGKHADRADEGRYVPLGGEKGVLGVDNSLSLGGLSDESLTVLGEGDDGGGGSSSLGVLENSGGLAIHDGDTRVGRSEIDTDDGSADLAVRHGSREERRALFDVAKWREEQEKGWGETGTRRSAQSSEGVQKK